MTRQSLSRFFSERRELRTFIVVSGVIWHKAAERGAKICIARGAVNHPGPIGISVRVMAGQEFVGEGHGFKLTRHARGGGAVLWCFRLCDLAGASAGRAAQGPNDQLPCGPDGLYCRYPSDGSAFDHDFCRPSLDRPAAARWILRMALRKRQWAVVAAFFMTIAGTVASA